MAKPPAIPLTPAEERAEKAAQRKAAEEDALKREIDEAVRQGELEEFGEKYGKPLAVAVFLFVAGLAAYLLWWEPNQRAEREARSETLVAALDQLEAGNLETASGMLEELSTDGSDAASANALLLRAGIAAQQGKTEEAIGLFDQLAQDGDAPQTLRNVATIRKIATAFDQMDKAEVEAALKPLATPGEPFFGSAGELLAAAYLEQGKRDQAGALYAQIAKDEDVPESLRSRARQMAGVLGVDAIEDVEALLTEQGIDTEGDIEAPGQ